MDPSSYYYGPFREHFASFWRSLETLGSVSRVRQHLTPLRVSEQANQHFSVADLVARPSRGLPDHLSQVPVSDQIDFLCALVYTILIDQVMYSHRPNDYAKFRSLTSYPKMDRTIGFARTMTMANPYELLDDEIIESRGIKKSDAICQFAAWSVFIAHDLRRFLTENSVGSTTWPQVRQAMLSDQSVIRGSAGADLARALEAEPNVP